MTLMDIVAAAANQRAVIDPTLLAVLSIFGGAALTAVATFFGAWRATQKEHEKWLRERRFDAYNAFNTQFEALVRFFDEVEQRSAHDLPRHFADRLRVLIDKQAEMIAPLKLVGPPSVEIAASNLLDTVFGTDADFTEARQSYVSAMRGALGIKS